MCSTITSIKCSSVLAKNFYGCVYLKDATELDQLISYLINKEDSEGVVLLGHSTGCQVIVDSVLLN